MLSVAQPGEGETQQRAHQYIYRKEDEENKNMTTQFLIEYELTYSDQGLISVVSGSEVRGFSIAFYWR